MYAKAIIPGATVDTPLILVTTAPGSVVAAQLHSLGWGRYGTHLVPVRAEVQIMPDHLVIAADGEELLRDDADPLSPPGWWDAVDRAEGRVVVVVLPAGTPISTFASGAALEGLIGDARTAQAIMPVRHS